MADKPGLVVLFGSGERAPSGRKVWDWLFRRLAEPVKVAILETPAGFEPNSALVAGRIADFMHQHLQNYQPQTTIVPARKRGTLFSPDDPDILRPMLDAQVLFLGPGSPTYAVRQLEGSLAWEILVARHQMGAVVVLASAAAIAAGTHALPVYEIYKVGEDLHWYRGLNFFERFGLSLVVIPHWNNAEGGVDLDTSRCYMGKARFARLLRLLPDDTAVVGIDEHTALILDPAAGRCQVMGHGGVTLLASGTERFFQAGEAFDLGLLGGHPISSVPPVTRPEVRALMDEARQQRSSASSPPPEVWDLVEQRETARRRKDWDRADRLREQIAAHGWRVVDTPEGPKLEPLKEAA